MSPDRSPVLCCWCCWCCSAVSVLGGLGSPVSVLLSPTGASQGNVLNNLQANNNTNSGPRVTKFTLVTTGYDVREEDYHRCPPSTTLWPLYSQPAPFPPSHDGPYLCCGGRWCCAAGSRCPT